jgi:hypothetical protein
MVGDVGVDAAQGYLAKAPTATAHAFFFYHYRARDSCDETMAIHGKVKEKRTKMVDIFVLICWSSRKPANSLKFNSLSASPKTYENSSLV